MFYSVITLFTCSYSKNTSTLHYPNALASQGQIARIWIGNVGPVLTQSVFVPELWIMNN